MYTFGACSAIFKKQSAPWYNAMLSIKIQKKCKMTARVLGKLANHEKKTGKNWQA